MKANVRLHNPTASEKKMATILAQDYLKKSLPLVIQNLEALILYQLHEQFGFGKQRLLTFFNHTTPMIKEMLEWANWDTDEEAIWLCKYKLKEEVGIDLDELTMPFKTDVEVQNKKER